MFHFYNNSDNSFKMQHRGALWEASGDFQLLLCAVCALKTPGDASMREKTEKKRQKEHKNETGELTAWTYSEIYGE